MTLDIAAIKARADRATAGPWTWEPSIYEHMEAEIVAKRGLAQLWKSGNVILDASFIAHARTDIPDLLAALEASESARVKAEQERDALKEALRQCISPIGGYAIKDSAQALEAVSDFLTQICRTSDIARRALEASK